MLCIMHALCRPGIGRNASCTSGDCLTSRPKGCSRPRELQFSIYSCVYVSGHVHVIPCGTSLHVQILLYCMHTAVN